MRKIHASYGNFVCTPRKFITKFSCSNEMITKAILAVNQWVVPMKTRKNRPNLLCTATNNVCKRRCTTRFWWKNLVRVFKINGKSRHSQVLTFPFLDGVVSVVENAVQLHQLLRQFADDEAIDEPALLLRSFIDLQVNQCLKQNARIR